MRFRSYVVLVLYLKLEAGSFCTNCTVKVASLTTWSKATVLAEEIQLGQNLQ